MSTLRSLERNIIKEKCRKKDGNTKAFNAMWKYYQHKKQKRKSKENNTTNV